MRRMTLLWLVLAAICGGVLFHTSQQVNDGRQRLAVINEDIRKEDETIRVLDAEWSYLNQPDRLEKLSKQYLNLSPLKGRQFAKLKDIADVPDAVPVAAQPVAAAAPVAETPVKAAEAATTPDATQEKPAEAPAKAAAVKPVEAAPVVAAAPEAPKKPAPVKTAAKPFVVKIRKPDVAAVVKHPAPVATAQSDDAASQRSFGDVIKSLGVR